MLAHSDLSLIDAAGDPIAPSYLKHRGYAMDHSPSLARVPGQNGVMGNTVLMNRALAELALPFPDSLHVHDWWLALMAELHGHRLFIEEASVAYRLHSHNASNNKQ